MSITDKILNGALEHKFVTSVDNVIVEEDEYLLRVRNSDNVGFMTKPNKTGKVPVKLIKWGQDYNGKNYKDYSKILIAKIDAVSGWKYIGKRYGMSANWIKVMHPVGFIIEVSMDYFLSDFVMKGLVGKGGVIKGKYKGFLVKE